MLTILMLALTACGGGSSALKEEANKVHTIPEDSQTHEGEPLPAGRYVTEEFKPAMSFALGKGWTRGGPELRDVWALTNDENYWLVFANAEKVYDPDKSGELRTAPAPEDMAAWLRSNPYWTT